MRGPRAILARSRRWPVRVRLAIVSAVLTAIILVAFAAVVGRLVSNRLHADLRNEVSTTAAVLASQTTVLGPDLQNNVRYRSRQGFDEFAAANDATIRIIDPVGNTFFATEGAQDLGGISSEMVREDGDLVIADEFIDRVPSIGPLPPLYLEYARSEATVDNTVGRLWLFLGGGVAIGALLAGFAGMAVAGRAMQPIASLTSAARSIATTRDPSERIPEPESDDEVAELSRTLAQMLRELDSARAETEGTMKRQREFVADASHELRTPLTSILANLELLEASLGGADDDDERAAVASALRSSRRMNRLVGDLLLLARADAGRVGLRAETDLARIAAEALEEVDPVADGHTFTSAIVGPARVIGNDDELHRMVLNLLENAIRHTPVGTSIALSVDHSDGFAHLTVSDDGPGLPSGMETQVFERFVRGEGPADRARRNGLGTGLGLSIVRAVATSHNGAVLADRSEQGGARFRVELPLAEV